MLFVPLRLAPSERDDLNLFDFAGYLYVSIPTGTGDFVNTLLYALWKF